jgi:large subunit ribosomal protein L18
VPADARRIGRTRRHERVRQRVAGAPERPRLTVFRSLTHIYAQVIDDRSGRTLAAASDLDVKEGKAPAAEKKGKTDRAKKVGTAIGEKAKAAGISEVVFDRGGYRYHGRVKALADGARETGLRF